MKKKFPKIMSALLAIMMVLSAIPMTAFAAPASDLPANMTDHSILRALEYTGYDVQQQKNDGTLYQSGSYGSRTPESVLSNIHYGTSTSGRETVADSSTPTGKAPDIAKFEQKGLCCAAFVSYYICNYLPNIEGADTQFITDAILDTGMNSQAVITWQTALNKLANSGKIEKIGTSSSNVDRSKLTPGDLIIFGTAENSHTHIAVYSGTYNGVDFIIHVGNDRGPEISRVDWMGQAGDKSSYPNAYFHLPQEIFESDGEIEVYKKDTDGNKLSGAVFVATNTESGKSYKIGPTNSNGYAKTANPVPYGTYTVRWEDCDFPNSIININHTLIYRKYTDETSHFAITTPKTKSGVRIIPMLSDVKSALTEEYKQQLDSGFNESVIDGYSGFIFKSRYNTALSPHCVNRAIDRIIKACNAKEEADAKAEGREPELLPHFSCHHLRHTFCTRFCENETNLKVIQEIMGHADITTTMDIYNEATKDKKIESFAGLEGKIKIR